MSGEPDGRVADLEARLRRVEAIIDTAKQIMAGSSGFVPPLPHPGASDDHDG